MASEFIFIVKDVDLQTLAEFETRYTVDNRVAEMLRAAKLPTGEYLYVAKESNDD